MQSAAQAVTPTLPPSLMLRDPSASPMTSLMRNPRAALVGRAAVWYICWLFLKAVAKQPCVAYLLQYWSLRLPRRLLGPPASAQAARARHQLQLLLFTFI
jgi:hypothetical protein